jgi:hypothetical protein
MFKKQTLPCLTDTGCPNGKVDLWACNHFAWQLYQEVSGQVIVAGMGDILGIKFEAIAFLFDIYMINDYYERQDLYQKIVAVDAVRMNIRNIEMKKNMVSKKAKK